jgi:hypothetical protein
MRRLCTPLLVLCLAAVGFVGCAKKARPRLPGQTAVVPLKRDFKLPLPIPVGEKLVYEVRVSRFPLYAAVGDVTFEYVGPTDAPKIEGLNVDLRPGGANGKDGGGGFLHFRAGAVSKGFIVNTLLGLDVQDRFEVVVNAADFATRAALKEINEGKTHTLQTALFDRAGPTASYRTANLNQPEQPAAEKTLGLAADAQDLLSAFYLVRLQELREGDVLRFPLVYDAAQHEFDLIVHGREEIEIELGKFKTLRLEPKLFGPGRLIRRAGEMTMWVTDDARHMPVKLIAKTSGATVTANLTSVTGGGTP